MNEAFFSEVRKHFGRLSQAQVDGFNTILKAAEGRQVSHVAYILATAWHETARLWWEIGPVTMVVEP